MTPDSLEGRIKTALVVNCSAPHYNLGAAKLADWLESEGCAVAVSAGDPGLASFGFDVVCLSVIFSWHAPLALEIALRTKSSSMVWCGGPGMTALAHWWKEQTGLDCTLGVDPRFDRMRGDYPFTFASRGCPVGCWFCIVPKLEGKKFTLDWDFRPAPVLCDNNLSALPVDFQTFVLARYERLGVILKDCNSGFEPRSFDSGTYLRWKGKFKGPWRFAYDEMRETEDVQCMMEILKAETPRKKQVYVLVGNESIASCHQRAQEVIRWGGEPHCQFVLPLNWLGDPAAIRPRHDWSYQLGKDFCRYYNSHGWRSYPINAYKPRIGEVEPFRELAA